MLALLSFGKKTVKNTLNINVKTNEQVLNIELDRNLEIKAIKEIVAEKLGISVEEIKIIFAGKELTDTTTIAECDLGQMSFLHAIKTKKREGRPRLISRVVEEDDTYIEDQPSKPLCETLQDLKLVQNDSETANRKAHFFVFCSHCKKLCRGKLRVRCSKCKSGAFTVYKDPECWDDVLKPCKIRGLCESNEESPCTENEHGNSPFAEFFFKCAEHSLGLENDFSAPLKLIRINDQNVPCLACMDVSETVLVFPCELRHVTCLDCFLQYCRSRLLERQFMAHPDIGYTLQCPTGCADSFIDEIHHFKLLTPEEYDRYQMYATEEYVLQAGGVLCPRPDCGMGLLVGPECKKVVCENGCGFVFCRDCLQGYHIGECTPETNNIEANRSCEYSVNPNYAAEARWEDVSTAVTIKVSTKPCPKCRTATERDGGCMHMVCTRSGCNFEWCWICQTEWTRDCMGAHWFG